MQSGWWATKGELCMRHFPRKSLSVLNIHLALLRPALNGVGQDCLGLGGDLMEPVPLIDLPLAEKGEILQYRDLDHGVGKGLTALAFSRTDRRGPAQTPLRYPVDRRMVRTC